jgi:hypothetical protein
VTAEHAGAGPPARVVVDVSRYRTPDLPLVDLLARLRLVTRRLGLGLVVLGASPELERLLTLVGLRAVVPLDPQPGSERLGHAEAGEEPGVEEVVDVHDAPVPQLEHLDRPRLEPPAGTGLVLGEGG